MLALVDSEAGPLPEAVQQALRQLGVTLWAAAQNQAHAPLLTLEAERDDALRHASQAATEVDRLTEELDTVTKQLTAANRSIATHKERLAAMESRLHEQELRIGERNLELERIAAQNVELTRALAAAVSADDSAS
ncbi:hypothetical protein WL29_21280 [Burkholderia ubonensis]|uniref:Uncharacterized protein n=1 Tax=Burkholderia ubonensis TaxID=101571 RepID=A0A106QBN7_9BURK|nr:hypothetical protein WL29_21280 [Burkholderia ubonensis]